MNTQTRVAIVGAGASGLTAAHTLKKLGYENVTLFESEPRVGGKVCSYLYGGNVYELGAVWTSNDYVTINNFAKEFQVKFSRSKHTDVMNMDGKSYSYPFYILRHFKIKEVACSAMRFISALRKFPELKTPNFAGVHSDLHLSFKDFSLKYELESFSRIISSFLTGCGYGYYEKVPAMYLLKLIPFFFDEALRCVLKFKVPELFGFDHGWQRLWEEVAKRHDVRIGTPVEKITRYQENSQSKIAITADGKTEFFDRLIISSLLNRANKYMDLSEKENELFSKIQHHNYLVSLVEGKQLKHVTILDHVTPDTMGHINAIGHFYKNTNVYSLYQLIPQGMTRESANKIIEQDVTRLGGRVDNVVTQRKWEYFPYISTDELNNGFYEKLDCLQGEQGTYYVGGVMNFETVEHTSRFSKYLINKKFNPAFA